MSEVKFSTGGGGSLNFSTTISAKSSGKRKGLSVTQFMNALQLRMVDYMKVEGVYQHVETVGARGYSIPKGGAPISDPNQKKKSGKNREPPGELRRGIHEGHSQTGTIQKRSIISDAPYTNAVIRGVYGRSKYGRRTLPNNDFLYRAFDYVYNTDNSLLVKGLGNYLMNEVLDVIQRPSTYGEDNTEYITTNYLSGKDPYTSYVYHQGEFDYVGNYHSSADTERIGNSTRIKTHYESRDYSYHEGKDRKTYVRNVYVKPSDEGTSRDRRYKWD